MDLPWLRPENPRAEAANEKDRRTEAVGPEEGTLPFTLHPWMTPPLPALLEWGEEVSNQQPEAVFVCTRRLVDQGDAAVAALLLSDARASLAGM